MSDIIEAAARALEESDTEWGMTNARIVQVILAAVTPLIRAAALEEAAVVADDYVGRLEIDAGEDIAIAIRALKERP